MGKFPVKAPAASIAKLAQKVRPTALKTTELQSGNLVEKVAPDWLPPTTNPAVVKERPAVQPQEKGVFVPLPDQVAFTKLKTLMCSHGDAQKADKAIETISELLGSNRTQLGFARQGHSEITVSITNHEDNKDTVIWVQWPYGLGKAPTIQIFEEGQLRTLLADEIPISLFNQLLIRFGKRFPIDLPELALLGCDPSTLPDTVYRLFHHSKMPLPTSESLVGVAASLGQEITQSFGDTYHILYQQAQTQPDKLSTWPLLDASWLEDDLAPNRQSIVMNRREQDDPVHSQVDDIICPPLSEFILEKPSSEHHSLCWRHPETGIHIWIECFCPFDIGYRSEAALVKEGEIVPLCVPSSLLVALIRQSKDKISHLIQKSQNHLIDYALAPLVRAIQILETSDSDLYSLDFSQIGGKDPGGPLLNSTHKYAMLSLLKLLDNGPLSDREPLRETLTRGERAKGNRFWSQEFDIEQYDRLLRNARLDEIDPVIFKAMEKWASEHSNTHIQKFDTGTERVFIFEGIKGEPSLWLRIQDSSTLFLGTNKRDNYSSLEFAFVDGKESNGFQAISNPKSAEQLYNVLSLLPKLPSKITKLFSYLGSEREFWESIQIDADLDLSQRLQSLLDSFDSFLPNQTRSVYRPLFDALSSPGKLLYSETAKRMKALSESWHFPSAQMIAEKLLRAFDMRIPKIVFSKQEVETLQGSVVGQAIYLALEPFLWEDPHSKSIYLPLSTKLPSDNPEERMWRKLGNTWLREMPIEPESGASLSPGGKSTYSLRGTSESQLFSNITANIAHELDSYIPIKLIQSLPEMISSEGKHGTSYDLFTEYYGPTLEKLFNFLELLANPTHTQEFKEYKDWFFGNTETLPSRKNNRFLVRSARKTLGAWRPFFLKHLFERAVHNGNRIQALHYWNLLEKDPPPKFLSELGTVPYTKLSATEYRGLPSWLRWALTKYFRVGQKNQWFFPPWHGDEALTTDALLQMGHQLIRPEKLSSLVRDYHSLNNAGNRKEADALKKELISIFHSMLEGLKDTSKISTAEAQAISESIDWRAREDLKEAFVECIRLLAGAGLHTTKTILRMDIYTASANIGAQGIAHWDDQETLLNQEADAETLLHEQLHHVEFSWALARKNGAQMLQDTLFSEFPESEESGFSMGCALAVPSYATKTYFSGRRSEMPIPSLGEWNTVFGQHFVSAKTLAMQILRAYQAGDRNFDGFYSVLGLLAQARLRFGTSLEQIQAAVAD